MRVLRIDEHSPFRQLVGVGGLGTGMFFALQGDHTLGRNESRLGSLLDVRDYCKLHIVMHYVAKLLGANQGQFPIMPLGKVGDDVAGAFVLREMRAGGIDTRFVEVVTGKPTLFSVCFQYPDGSGGNITTANSVAAELSEEDIDHAESLFQAVDPKTIALLVPEVPLTCRLRFLDVAKQKGAFTAASFVSGEIADAKRLGMFDQLSLVSLNEEEAANLVDEPFTPGSPEVFVDKLFRLVALKFAQLLVVMSAGKKGAYFVDRSGWSYSPAPKAKVASTAGAGDCLLGGVLSAMAAGISLPSTQGRITTEPVLENALDFGVLLASYKVSSPHTIHPDASLDELLRFAQELGTSVVSEIEQLVSERDHQGRPLIQ
jgi:sugar/nucleoside kinase (ribokinase family)